LLKNITGNTVGIGKPKPTKVLQKTCTNKTVYSTSL